MKKKERKKEKRVKIRGRLAVLEKRIKLGEKREEERMKNIE